MFYGRYWTNVRISCLSLEKHPHPHGGNYRENGQEFDVLASEYAKELGLPGTRGTDCHNISGEGTVLNKRVSAFDELILSIKNNDFR